jgi:Flp pilus assembly protein TadG
MIREPAIRPPNKRTRKIGRPIRQDRRGVAATETAILLPTFVLIVFAAIECSNALYLRQSLTLAAYEAATVLSDPSGTEAQATTTCDAILEARNIETFTLSVTPVSLNTLNPGDIISVQVSAPASAYSIGPAWFFAGRTLTATVHMVRTS